MEKNEKFKWENIGQLLSEKKEKYMLRVRKVYEFLINKPIKSSIIISFFWLIFIEAMSRRSLGAAVTFSYSEVSVFLLNWLIVLTPFLLTLIVTKRIAIYVLGSLIWAVIGITDFYMLTYRTTPFTGVDLQDISNDELKIAFDYVGIGRGIMIFGGIALVVVLIVLLFVKTESAKRKLKWFQSLIIMIVCWGVIYLSILVGINVDVLSTRFSNLAIAYHKYGIAYCFTMTVVDTGISEPKDYSEEVIGTLVNKSEKNSTKTHPNIIFLQLESFIDPKLIKGVNYSEDPIPYYRKLRKKYSSGYVTVPTIVAGTCNTEFETITGMSLEFFGPGEYPYKTILKEKTCESIAYDLKNIGYTTHAIHNHTSSFYGRNEVYANMGFDTFTGIEMMHDFTRTASKRWSKDDVLPECIIDCLKSSENEDLIYTISLQCHGVYTFELPEEEKVISVSGIEDENLAKQYEYFVNMEKQEDNFIKDLAGKLTKYGKKTGEDIVLVMYGDHIPGLNLEDESFGGEKTKYETEYVIWDNMNLIKKDYNLKSYQMAAEVFDRVGIHEGTIFNYHQNTDSEKEDYLEGLHQLQYDMLYGNEYAYGKENPYKKTDIKYGVKDIVINKVTYSEKENALYIEGGDFSEYTKVFINEKKYDATLISSSVLKIEIDMKNLEEKNTIVTKQVADNGNVYFETKEFIYLK